MNKKILLASAMFSLLLSGCANQSLNDTFQSATNGVTSVLNTFLVKQDGMPLTSRKEENSGELNSRKDVDTAYLKVKRALGMKSVDEMMSVDTSTSHGKWVKAAVEEKKIIHVTRPGLFYKMARNYSDKCRMTVTLEKNGRGTSVYWNTRGYQDYCSELVHNLKKAL